MSVGFVMHLTLKRKISFGLVGVALIAFVVDRVTSSDGPEVHPQAVAHAAASPTATRAKAPAPIDADARIIELSVISGRLQTLAETEGLDADNAQDAFHSAASWLTQAKPQNDGSAEITAAVARFRQQHKLLAIVKSGRTAMALVDGKTFRRGQTLDGFKVVEVRDRSVVFDSGAAKVEIYVAGAEPTASDAEDFVITPSRSGRAVQDP